MVIDHQPYIYKNANLAFRCRLGGEVFVRWVSQPGRKGKNAAKEGHKGEFVGLTDKRTDGRMDNGFKEVR